MSEGAGGSFLTSVTSGTPAEAQSLAPAEQAIQEVQDGPPEYIPVKYWDGEKKAPRIEELGRGYQSLEKLLGRDKIPMPVGDDDQEGWDRVYKAVGRPDKAEDYEFERPTLPSDLPYDEDTEKNFRTWAHVNGLSKRQARALYDGFVKTQVERHAGWLDAQKKQRGELETALAREHGGKIEQVKQTAHAVMTQYADDQFRQYLDETGLGNDPRMVRFLAKVGAQQMGETRLAGPKPQAAASGDLDKAIGEFRGKHNKALYDKTHPDHDRLVAEFNKLFEQRYSERA